MIGRVYKLGERSKAGLILWGFLLGALVLPAVMNEDPHLGLAAVLPGVFFLRALLPSRKPMVLVVQEEGLFDEAGDQWFPYDSIQSLRIGRLTYAVDGTVPNRHIEILTDSSLLVIPAHAEAGALYRFLIERLPAGGAYEVPEKLKKYWDAEVATFGEEMVWAYAGRTFFPKRNPQALGTAALLALVFVIWIGGGIAIGRGGEGWIGISVLGFFISGLILLVRLQGTDKALVKLAPNSGLVISPRGLALTHGPVSGKLRWDEIKQIGMAGTKSFRVGNTGNGLVITVAGSSIVVPDVFEKPLPKIHQQLLHYWNAG